MRGSRLITTKGEEDMAIVQVEGAFWGGPGTEGRKDVLGIGPVIRMTEPKSIGQRSAVSRRSVGQWVSGPAVNGVTTLAGQAPTASSE